MQAQNVTVVQADVLYVGHQISLDLQALSRAYPRVVSLEDAFKLFNSVNTFLYNAAVSELGFTIVDPDANNLVYHESQYKVLYGGEVRAINPTGQQMGHGSTNISSVWVPTSATFVPWVVWSQTMRDKTASEQQQIVAGTDWPIPGQGTTFERRFEGGTYGDGGFYGRGDLGVQVRVYRRE